MRKLFLLASVTAVAIAAIAASAGARTETKFSVVVVQKSAHRSGNSFIVRGTLVKPRHRHDVVGHHVVKFAPRAHGKVRARAISYFRGEGTIKEKGLVGPGDNRVPIIGGTGEFNGAAGKLLVHSLNKQGTKSRLTFIFVR